MVKVRVASSGTGYREPSTSSSTVSLAPLSVSILAKPGALLRLTRDVSNAKSISRALAAASPGISLTPVWEILTTMAVPDPAAMPSVPPSPGTCVSDTVGCAEVCPANISNAKAVVNKRLFFKNITNSSIENGIGKPQLGNFPIHRRIT